MYHLFDFEVRYISVLNGIALICFSLGGFFASCTFSIVVGYGFANQNLSEFGAFLLYRGAWFIGALAALFFAGGVGAVFWKKSSVDQIKKESRFPNDDAQSASEAH